MHILKTLPIKVSGGWDSIDTLAHFYYKVEFTEDFGVFKAGELFNSISVDYSNGVIEAYSEEKGNEDQVVKRQKYLAIVTE